MALAATGSKSKLELCLGQCICYIRCFTIKCILFPFSQLRIKFNIHTYNQSVSWEVCNCFVLTCLTVNSIASHPILRTGKAYVGILTVSASFIIYELGRSFVRSFASTSDTMRIYEASSSSSSFNAAYESWLNSGFDASVVALYVCVKVWGYLFARVVRIAVVTNKL